MNAIVPESGSREVEAERGVAGIVIGVGEGPRDGRTGGGGEPTGSAEEAVGGAEPQPAWITKKVVTAKDIKKVDRFIMTSSMDNRTG
jgi:hypothetical protein